MTDRSNNEITEDLVRIRELPGMDRADRDTLADAANRIQNQGKALTNASQNFEAWLQAEHDGGDVHDHENLSELRSWKNQLEVAFKAGRNSSLQLTTPELAAVLAGLRLLQVQLPSLTSGIQSIYDADGELTPLDENALDDLCEKINLGPN